MKYLTKRSCERAIERRVRTLKLKGTGFVLAPERRGRLWEIDVTFPVEARARGLAAELQKMRTKIDAATYHYSDDRSVGDVKGYWDRALRGAIVALWEIEAVFAKGEGKEKKDD